MSYTVEIVRSAVRNLNKIPVDDRNRIIDAIRGLADNPRPPGCRKLTGREAWRVRIGSYRVIYEIHDSRLTVLIVAAGKRSEIYRA